jgi:hypothetical protein
MTYFDMLRNWAGMARGKSYWHRAQGIGRAFVPGMLKGYFNDLTHKAQWEGEIDEHGIPVSVFAGKKVNWPVTVLQKGLGHWDLWLASAQTSESDRRGFEDAACWALRTQDADGGWRFPLALHPQAISPLSCISQGEGASLLVRAYSASNDARFLHGAERAIDAMLRPVTSGGTAVYEGQSLFLEEIPKARRTTILNGSIFALFGIYDLSLVKEDAGTRDALSAAVRGVAANLSCYDNGYWSLYDLQGTIASPFYHKLHIAQLEALGLSFPEYGGIFAEARSRFIEQYNCRRQLIHAVSAKIVQKLCHPPSLVQMWK